MKRIALYTKNAMLARRISLIVQGAAEPCEAGSDADLVIIDKESYPELDIEGYTLPYTEADGVIRNLPISHRELLDAISQAKKSEGKKLTLDTETREAYLGREKIKLTEVEARLLSALLEADGYVLREELLNTVWGDDTDRGVVNVYVHYLREKLEAGGDKIILSSRREGYMIDKRFKRG